MRLLERLLTLVVVLAALTRPKQATRLPTGVDPEDLEAGFERSDMRVGSIIVGGIGLLVSLGVVLVVASVFEATVTGQPVRIGPPNDLVNRLSGAPAPPPPRLEPAEGTDLAAYRAAAEQKLNSYGWVDRATGTVRIPIAQAMDQVAREGLPAATPTGAQDTGVSLPSRASSGRVNEQVRP